MRVLVASSFHISSTRDLWMKTIAGLRANGVEALPFDLMARLKLFAFLADKAGKSKDVTLPRDWTPTTLAYECVTGAAISHDCDWVLVVSPQYFPGQIADILRKVGIRTAAMFTECPYEDTIHTPITASHFDVSLLSDKYSVGLFESFCPRVEYVPHSFNPELHYPPESEDERDDNVVFIGTGYQSRVRFMRQVEWPARFDLYGFWPAQWLRYDAPMRKAIRKKFITTPEETADIYRQSAASFSLHREMRYVGTEESIMEGEAYSLGPRNWELAASRCFQVSDYRPELVDAFGDTVPIYETPREMSAQLKRAFDDPSWRRDMAYAQWERAQPYSCHRTMSVVADVLKAA